MRIESTSLSGDRNCAFIYMTGSQRDLPSYPLLIIWNLIGCGSLFYHMKRFTGGRIFFDQLWQMSLGTFWRRKHRRNGVTMFYRDVRNLAFGEPTISTYPYPFALTQEPVFQGIRPYALKSITGAGYLS